MLYLPPQGAVMEDPARQAIAILKDEHRSMSAVVKGMQARVTAAAAGIESFDAPLLRAMLDYIEMLPDRIHHPKEDQYLFRLLRERSQAAVGLLDELESEHHHARKTLSALRGALERAEASSGAKLVDLRRGLDDYALLLREHMRREEELVLPMARACLKEEDWQEIARAFSANRNFAW